MGTNKHKVRSKRTKKVESQAAPEEPETQDAQPSALPTFTKAQLSGMTFMFLGISKAMEFFTALYEKEPAGCLLYLGNENEETCRHPHFRSLIMLKFFSAMSLTALVLSMMLHLWRNERTFMKFLTCLTMSPLLTTVFASFYSHELLERFRMWHLVMLCVVLFVTSVPLSVENVAFLQDRQFPPKNPASATLFVLALASIWEIGRVFVLPGEGLENSILETALPLPAPAKVLVYFWMVDKLSMALILLFAAVHLDSFTQSTFVGTVSLVKLGEFFYMIPRMADPFQDVDTVNAVTIGTAALSAVACVASLLSGANGKEEKAD